MKYGTHLGLGRLVQCVAAKADRALGGRHLQHPCNKQEEERSANVTQSTELTSPDVDLLT